MDKNQSPNSTPRPTGISQVLAKAYEYQVKNWKMLALFMAVPVLFQYLADMLWEFKLGGLYDVNQTLAYLLVFIVIPVLGAVCDFLGFGGAIKYLVSGAKEGWKSFADCIKYAQNRFWEAVTLAFRIFFYTYAWLLLLILLGLTGQTILMWMGINALDIAALNNSGLYLALGLAFVGVLILVTIRGLETSFAFAILLADEKINSAEALNKSIALSRELKGTIFVNYFLLGLIFAVIGGAYAAAVGAILTDIMDISAYYMSEAEYLTFAVWSGLLTMPLLIVLQGFAASFQLAFMENATEEKKIFGGNK